MNDTNYKTYSQKISKTKPRTNLSENFYLTYPKRKLQMEPRHIDRNQKLYEMSKTNILKRMNIYTKGQREKEIREMAKCTFSPKISPLNLNLFRNKEEKPHESNDIYVYKMKKLRESRENIRNSKINYYTKSPEHIHKTRVTIPKAFKFNLDKKYSTSAFSPTSSYKNIKLKNGATTKRQQLKDMCNYYQQNEVNFDNGTSYKDAIKLLHNKLLETKNDSGDEDEQKDLC